MDKIETITKLSLPTVCDKLLLGDFDGLHLGHRSLFDGVTDESIVFTFSENTKRTMGLIGATLYPEYVNRALMGELGVGRVYYEDFSAIRDYSPEQFVEYITSLFSPKTVVCGENFTFGKNAVGDSRLLSELLEKKNVDCKVYPSVVVGDEVVSSSLLRRAVSDGDMILAGKLLGAPYFISGTVVHGKALGRKIGTPTVNVPIYSECVVPKIGVYISELFVGEKRVVGVTNVGVRPTVDVGGRVNTETYLLDFDDELYGERVVLKLRKYLRGEKKFDSTEMLSSQILDDSKKTFEFFKNC